MLYYRNVSIISLYFTKKFSHQSLLAIYNSFYPSKRFYKMSPTIKDVAKKAGVSLSTVSLVINEKSNVSGETRKKVAAAIADLGFHPRRAARGLASKKTHNIGFILTEDHFSRAEPFYTKIFLGTEFEARKYNYYILLTTVPKNFNENLHLPRFLLEKNIDGVILAGKVPTKLIKLIQKANLPVILIDYSTQTHKISKVLIDNHQGVSLAVEHLIQNGHRKIAFIGGEINHPSICERLRGYEETMHKHNLPTDDLIFCDEPYTSVNNGYAATSCLFAKEVKFTAIVASNDTMATGAMRCLREKNLNIPRDVSIIGFDDIEVCLQVEPRLSTIRVYKEELGAIAVRRAIEGIENKTILLGQTLIPVELVLRESTGRAPNG